jgi:hypothetical protein
MHKINRNFFIVTVFSVVLCLNTVLVGRAVDPDPDWIRIQ